MKNIIRLILGFTLLTLLGCGESKQVSEEEKKAILHISTEVMEASTEGNVQRIMSYLSREVVINVNKDGKEPYSYDYNSYSKYLSQVFSVIDSYSYIRRAEKFTFNEIGQIQFEFELDEKYSFQGNEIKESHLEKWTVMKKLDSFIVLRIEAE